jgi:hypothetical protein
MNSYGTKYLNRLTTPRSIAGNNDVPDITIIIMIIFMKTSLTNNVIPLFLEEISKKNFSLEKYLPN